MTEFGLKGTHVMCLFFLYHNLGGLIAAQLCQLCAEDKAAISHTLAILQEKGYIQSGEKKYRTKITLTEKGISLEKQVDGIIEQWVGFGSAGVTEEERDSFYHVLEVTSSNLRENLKRK